MTENERPDTYTNDVVQGLLAEIAFAKLEKARQATRSGGPRRAPGTAPAAAALIDLRDDPNDESAEPATAPCDSRGDDDAGPLSPHDAGGSCTSDPHGSEDRTHSVS